MLRKYFFLDHPNSCIRNNLYYDQLLFALTRVQGLLIDIHCGGRESELLTM